MLGELDLELRVSGDDGWHLGHGRDAAQQLRGELVQTEARNGRGHDHGHVGPEAGLPLRARRSTARLVDEIAFGEGQDSGERRQPRVVARELVLDGRVIGDRVRAVEGAEVEHVDQQPGALDVRQELVAEAGAAAGALDQSRDIRDHELSLFAVKRPEHRLQRRERIIGDLGLGARQAREEG